VERRLRTPPALKRLAMIKAQLGDVKAKLEQCEALVNETREGSRQLMNPGLVRSIDAGKKGSSKWTK
jgi:hypothetical protein